MDKNGDPTKQDESGGIRVEPRMASAGAELMALSFRLAEHPEFTADAERVCEIGAWASVQRPSDMERSLIAVLGSMMDAMRRRNFAFSQDLPIGAQFAAFLDQIPDPLPGEAGYVDQDTLAPLDRRDTFEADVDMADVRRWTAGDQVERAVARTCTVRPPNGEAGETMVFAEGDTVPQLVEGQTARLKLRSAGGALRIEN